MESDSLLDSDSLVTFIEQNAFDIQMINISLHRTLCCVDNRMHYAPALVKPSITAHLII